MSDPNRNLDSFFKDYHVLANEALKAQISFCDSDIGALVLEDAADQLSEPAKRKRIAFRCGVNSSVVEIILYREVMKGLCLEGSRVLRRPPEKKNEFLMLISSREAKIIELAD